MSVGKVVVLEGFDSEGCIKAVGSHLQSQVGGLSQGCNMVIGFEGCVFEENAGVVGSVEDIVARVALRAKIIDRQNVKGCVLPAWFSVLMKRTAKDDEFKDFVPKNKEEIFTRAKVIKGRLGRERLSASDICQIIDEIFCLDVLIMEWVEFFFKNGIETRFFLERARWFDWYRPHDIWAFTLNAVLPSVRTDVVAFIRGLRRVVNMEVHMVTGSLDLVVDAALDLHSNLKSDLGVSCDRIHASTRGIEPSDRTLSYFGAKPMHPLVKRECMDELSPQVAVVAKRSLTDPVAAKVLANGGVVVAV